jgi:hypothetical protein
MELHLEQAGVECYRRAYDAGGRQRIEAVGCITVADSADDLHPAFGSWPDEHQSHNSGDNARSHAPEPRPLAAGGRVGNHKGAAWLETGDCGVARGELTVIHRRQPGQRRGPGEHGVDVDRLDETLAGLRVVMQHRLQRDELVVSQESIEVSPEEAVMIDRGPAADVGRPVLWIGRQ